MTKLESLILNESFTQAEIKTLEQHEDQIRAEFLSQYSSNLRKILDERGLSFANMELQKKLNYYPEIKEEAIAYFQNNRLNILDKIASDTANNEVTSLKHLGIVLSDDPKKNDAFLELLNEIYNITYSQGMNSVGKGEVLIALLLGIREHDVSRNENGDIYYNDKGVEKRVEVKAAGGRLYAGSEYADNITAEWYDNEIKKLDSKYGINLYELDTEDAFSFGTGKSYKGPDAPNNSQTQKRSKGHDISALVNAQRSAMGVPTKVIKTCKKPGHKSASFDFGTESSEKVYPKMGNLLAHALPDADAKAYMIDFLTDIQDKRFGTMKRHSGAYFDNIIKDIANETVSTTMATGRKTLSLFTKMDMIAYAVDSVTGEIVKNDHFVLCKKVGNDIYFMDLLSDSQFKTTADNVEVNNIKVNKIGHDRRDANLGLEINK